MKKLKKNVKKPGTNVGNDGGIYQEIGTRGRLINNFCTVPDNQTLPPTTEANHGWARRNRTPNSKRKK